MQNWWFFFEASVSVRRSFCRNRVSSADQLNTNQKRQQNRLLAAPFYRVNRHFCLRCFPLSLFNPTRPARGPSLSIQARFNSFVLGWQLLGDLQLRRPGSRATFWDEIGAHVRSCRRVFASSAAKCSAARYFCSYFRFDDSSACQNLDKAGKEDLDSFILLCRPFEVS